MPRAHIVLAISPLNSCSTYFETFHVSYHFILLILIYVWGLPQNHRPATWGHTAFSIESCIYICTTMCTMCQFTKQLISPGLQWSGREQQWPKSKEWSCGLEPTSHFLSWNRKTGWVTPPVLNPFYHWLTKLPEPTISLAHPIQPILSPLQRCVQTAFSLYAMPPTQFSYAF